jgi:SAM-dependent methyltransferase
MGNQVEQGFFSPFLQRARIDAAKPYITGRVLDIGCGNGRLAAWVRPELYVGVDRDREALGAARAAFPKYTFVETLPHEGDFDTIVALAVIEHLKVPQAELAAWSKLLAERGKILLTTPHKSFRLVHELGSRAGLFSREAADEHEEMFDHASLTARAHEAGLRVERYARFLAGANQLFVLAPRVQP